MRREKVFLNWQDTLKLSIEIAFNLSKRVFSRFHVMARERTVTLLGFILINYKLFYKYKQPFETNLPPEFQQWTIGPIDAGIVPFLVEIVQST